MGKERTEDSDGAEKRLSYRVGGNSTDNITGEQIRSESIQKHRMEQSKAGGTALELSKRRLRRATTILYIQYTSIIYDI